MIEGDLADCPDNRLLTDVTRYRLFVAAVKNYGLLFALALVVAIFSLIHPETFPTAANATMIGSTNAVLAMLALAALPPLIVGQFDLSIGFQMGLAQSLLAGLLVQQRVDIALALGLTILAGLLIGLLNGLLVAILRLNAFIITLATGILVEGATQWYTDGQPIFGALPHSLSLIGQTNFGIIPIPVLLVIAAAALMWVVYEFTTPGRRAVATGANFRAARLSGVAVRTVTFASFVWSSILSTTAGVMSTAIMGSASPGTGGSLLLPAFAGAFLGTTSFRPGRFNAPGTALAIYVLAAGISGLQEGGVHFYIEQLFYGVALLLSVMISKFAFGSATDAH